MTYVIPEIGVSYDLEYYEKYKAGIRVTFSPNERKFSVKADSRIPQKKVHEFMLSKASLFEKWLDKRDERTPITLPSDSRSPAACVPHKPNAFTICFSSSFNNLEATAPEIKVPMVPVV